MTSQHFSLVGVVVKVVKVLKVLPQRSCGNLRFQPLWPIVGPMVIYRV